MAFRCFHLFAVQLFAQKARHRAQWVLSLEDPICTLGLNAPNEPAIVRKIAPGTAI
jgi:hypothetical protein